MRWRANNIAAIVGLLAPLWLHFITSAAHANELVDGTYISESNNVRFTPPRKDWRLSIATPYPGVLLWIRHVPSTALMLFTGQTVTEAEACKLPKECQQGTLAQGMACSLALTLKRRGLETSTVNVADVAWFDFNTKRRFIRQAVVAFDDNVFSLVLSAESAEQRLTLSRAFERAIKTVQPNDDLAHADQILDPLRCSGLEAQPSQPQPIKATPNQPTSIEPTSPATPAPPTDNAPTSQPQKAPTPAPQPQAPSPTTAALPEKA